MRFLNTHHLLALAICVALITGCSESRDSLTEKMVTNLEDFNQVLSNITDMQSAKAAKPKLETIGKELQNLKKRTDALPPPSAKEQQQIQAKYQTRMVNLMRNLMGTAMKLAMKPEIAEELKEPMKSLQGLN